MLIGPPYTPRVAGLGALVADRREHGRRQRSNWKERPNGVEGMVAVAPASGTAKAVASVDSSAGRSQWLSAAGQRLRCGRCLSLAASSSGFVAAVASATGQGGMFLAAVALLASCAMPSSTAPSGTRGFLGPIPKALFFVRGRFNQTRFLENSRSLLVRSRLQRPSHCERRGFQPERANGCLEDVAVRYSGAGYKSCQWPLCDRADQRPRAVRGTPTA